MEYIDTAKRIVKWFLPYGFVRYYQTINQLKYEEKKRQDLIAANERIKKMRKIRKYFLNLNHNEQDTEISEIINYFESNAFSVFPYDFTKKYNPDDINVFIDKSCNMKYILHDNKRMYFPRKWNLVSIRNYYNGLCIEQDKDSPHRYETPDYIVKQGDIIADIGAAEGIWALTYADKADKIYLFECDPGWIKALRKTFKPWRNKVFIINKYVTNISGGKDRISLDDYIQDGRINFIKADIEGAEIQLLEGAKKVLLAQDDLKLLLCAYHRKNDEILLKGRFFFEVRKQEGIETAS
jgi:hypothetical protein